jgi:hypothetical protein
MNKLVAVVALALAPVAIAQVAPGRQPNQPPPYGRTNASYVLKVEAPPAKKGQKALAKLKITPAAGYHMNKEYPTSLVLNAVPAGVLVDKMKQTAKDAAKFEEAGAEFDVAYTAANAGKQVVAGEIKFAVCTPSSCDPQKSAVSFELDVK